MSADSKSHTGTRVDSKGQLSVVAGGKQSPPLSPASVTYQHEVASIPVGEANCGSCLV